MRDKKKNKKKSNKNSRNGNMTVVFFSGILGGFNELLWHSTSICI